MKAIVLYYSHKGKTARYAREIALYLWSKGLHVSLSSLSDFEPSKIKEADMLITGCWTCGWFVVGQHLTSSSCHPKIFVKEFSYFLMPCHQHCLGVNLLVQR